MAYLEGLWRTTGTPGISAAVALRGKIVFSVGVGFADLENHVPATGTSVYNIGSVSKVNTAVAVMQLFEQGKISLEDPIQRYVPAFPEKRQGTVTIRHLMTHTAGIRHYRHGEGESSTRRYSFDDSLTLFKDDALLFKPGESWFYSSFGVNLLQGVIETVSGLSFESYMREHVWRPAGMLSTSLDVPERIVPRRARGYTVTNNEVLNYPFTDLSYVYAAGGMLSTAEDVVRFASALNRGSLLRPETVQAMYRPQVDPVQRFEEKGPPTKQDYAQGLVWRVFKDASGRVFVNHCGTVKGFNACLVDYPDQDLAVALLGNGDPVTPARREAIALAQFFLAPRDPR